ncbi:MAG: HDOD domain-containing protein [Kiritimatiellae bacterium]|nr:HDOD domain-containing protein [Kiritimatiellia bacterium]
MANNKEILRMNIERVVKNLNGIPVPGHVHQAIKQVGTHNGSILDISRIIESDAMLTIRVLRSINSAAYGLPRKIANIHEAVALMGFRQLRELCSDVSVYTPQQEEEVRYGYNRMAIWYHSLGTAVAAKLINEQITGRSDPTMYIAGLLSNIGRVVLDTFFPEQFQAALKLAFDEELSLRHAERRIFGVSSETIAYWAACGWELSEPLSDMLNDHYGKGSVGNSWVIDLAGLLAESLGMGTNGSRFYAPLKPGILRKNGITKHTTEGFVEMLDDAYHDLRSIYGNNEQNNPEKQVSHD